MIKSVLITLLIAAFATTSFGQRQKFVYLEGGGSGVLVNANFDMRFKKDARDGLGFKVGFGHTEPYISDANIGTIPLGINYLYGKGNHGLLLGANATFGIYSDSNYDDGKRKVDVIGSFLPSVEVGYRFKPVKGFSFQATYNPLLNTVDGFKPFWFGIGLGYTWK